MVVVLRFNDRYGETAAPIQDIIGKLGTFLITVNKVTVQTDLTVGDPCFHCNSALIPFCEDSRSDILKFNIFLRHFFF